MPRHNMIIEGKRSPERLMGRSPGGSEVSLAGVRSPPLQGGEPGGDGLAGKGLGTTLKAVFSKRRTLCVRDYGPDANRGIT